MAGSVASAPPPVRLSVCVRVCVWSVDCRHISWKACHYRDNDIQHRCDKLHNELQPHLFLLGRAKCVCVCCACASLTIGFVFDREKTKDPIKMVGNRYVKPMPKTIRTHLSHLRLPELFLFISLSFTPFEPFGYRLIECVRMCGIVARCACIRMLLARFDLVCIFLFFHYTPSVHGISVFPLCQRPVKAINQCERT